MVRVLLVDDEALVRSGLRMLLETDPDVDVVAEAGDGAAALDAARAHRPDVCLMDIRMPGVNGLEATARMRELNPAPRVIVLTTFDLDEYVYSALGAGAAGFLLKDTPPRELCNAVHVVAAGDGMLSPTVTRRLIAHFADAGAPRAVGARERLKVLTPREAETLALVAAGLSNAEIGKQLYMSEATVKAHVSRTLSKLGIDNRVQAAMVAHDAGLRQAAR